MVQYRLMEEEVEIRVIDEATPELAEGLTRLLPQLLSNPITLSAEQLTLVIAQPGVKLFVAMLAGQVVGTAQLSVYRRIYSPMGWVDGVVVDGEIRGKGIGTKLMQAVIDAARELGLPELSLTSNPKREAANHLYQKLGFELYETNYYRIKF